MASAESSWTQPVLRDGSVSHEDLIDTVWSYFEWDRDHARIEWARPASREQLRALVAPAFRASLRSEEESPARFQAVFEHDPRQATVRFDRPMPCDASHLVKLSPTARIGHGWLVLTPTPGSETPVIIGICDPLLTPHPTTAGILTRWGQGMGMNVADVVGLTISVLGPGWLRVATWAQRLFTLRACSLRVPFTVHEVPMVRRWHAELGDRVGSQRPMVGRALVRRVWGSVISRVRDVRHGGCFLVVPEDADAARLPVELMYPADSAIVTEVLHARMRLEPALSQHVRGRDDLTSDALEDAHFLERDVAQVCDLLASLALVDGAVVLRRNLEIIGFGAEIRNVASPEDHEVVSALDRPGPVPTPALRPLTSFGMRHRSAHRFCEAVEGSIAFVVSQDGDIRVFCNDGGKVVLYEGPTPEDWVLAS